MYKGTYHKFSNNSSGGCQTRVRLVMFGFAGGRVAALMSLAKELPSWIEVWGAEYPGRGFRGATRALSSVSPLLDDLTPGLRALCDRPVVLLGYSMGASVAYRLALNSSGQVLGVIAASAAPPGLRMMDWRKHSDQQLLEHFKALGGIPPEILSTPTIMDAFLPVVRADLACCLDMNHLASPRLSCPILVIHGSADSMVSKTEAELWMKFSRAQPHHSSHKIYPGGHFFHHGHEETIALDIARWLSDLLNTTNSSRKWNAIF